MKGKKEKKEKEVPSTNSMRTFVLFCVAVLLIIFVSLSFRVFQLVKNSKFDGSSGFIMAIHQSDGKKTVLYSFDPQEKTMSQVIMSTGSSLPDIRQTYLVPIEGSITKKTVSESPKLPLEFTSYSLYAQPDADDISFLDAVRVWLYARTLSSSHIKTASLTLPTDSERFASETEGYFIDSRLEDDKKSIMIVNGTSVSGLGGRLEGLLNTIGASVISVTTAHTSIPVSKIIYYGEKNYTVEKLEKILPFPSEQREGESLSDILIEIGEDAQRTDQF